MQFVRILGSDRLYVQDTLDTLAHCELEEHVPVKLTTSHPLVEDGGDTVWNVGTSVDPEGKGGYSYSVVRFRRDRPGVTGTMMIEDAQVRLKCYSSVQRSIQWEQLIEYR